MMADDLAGLDGAVLVFDLDGTLVDSAPDLIGALNVILAAEGAAPLPLDQGRPFIGQGARRLIQRGLRAQGRDADEAELDRLTADFIAYYQDHSADLTRPFPGAVEALTRARGAGARLAVCTNKLTRLSLPILEALGVAPLLDAVVGADSAPASKPDARHLLAAIHAAGGRRERAVMVGDAAPDAGAARAARVPLVLVSFGYTDIPAEALAPDALISHYDDLLPACLGLLAACEGRAGKL